MPLKEETEIKTRVVVTPVCDVLSGLRLLGDLEGCEDENPPPSLRKARDNMRPRLRANLSQFFDSDCYPGLGLLSLLGKDYAQDVPTFLQTLYQLPLTELMTAMLRFGRIFRGNTISESKVEELQGDRDALTEYIERSTTLPPPKVVGLADLLMHPVEARDNLAELIEHFWYVIMPAEAEKRLQTQQQLAELSQQRLTELGLNRLVTLMSNFYLARDGDDYHEVILAPSSYNNELITATENIEDGLSTLILVFGEGSKGLKTARSGSEVDEVLDATYFSELYNILADPTRLKIVQALAERPHYGQELAKMFGITNATVFYHLSMLDKKKIVHLERIEHRVYYVLDTERLSQLLAQGSTFLLG